jgi:integrase
MWQEFFARKRIRNISEISHSVIADFQVETEISPRTFNNALTLLRSVLNTAIDWGIIESNPTRGYKKVKIPKKLRYFRDEELEKLWDTATPRLRSIIALGAYAGLRNGEMINLQWRDIDFRGKRLEVRSDDEATPKGKRPRSVPMHGKLIRALKAYRGKTAEGFVFPRNDGRGPKSGKEGPSREFSKLLKQVGVGGRLHDLRHTFGSRLVKKGVPLPVVKDLMGHADIESTMIYVHLHPTQYREAIDLL